METWASLVFSAERKENPLVKLRKHNHPNECAQHEERWGERKVSKGSKGTKPWSIWRINRAEKMETVENGRGRTVVGKRRQGGSRLKMNFEGVWWGWPVKAEKLVILHLPPVTVLQAGVHGIWHPSSGEYRSALELRNPALAERNCTLVHYQITTELLYMDLLCERHYTEPLIRDILYNIIDLTFKKLIIQAIWEDWTHR